MEDNVLTTTQFNSLCNITMKTTIFKTLLYISVSPQGENSRSRALGETYVRSFVERFPDTRVLERDLNANPVPHLNCENAAAVYNCEENLAKFDEGLQLRFALVSELLQADEILISTPKWNWSAPSVLKAYIDQIIFIGLLDPYSNKKLEGKRVTIVFATGGPHRPGLTDPSAYLKHVFSALGASDIEAIGTHYGLAGESLVDRKEVSFLEAKAAVINRVISVMSS
eukprot:gene12681-13889_t